KSAVDMQIVDAKLLQLLRIIGRHSQIVADPVAPGRWRPCQGKPQIGRREVETLGRQADPEQEVGSDRLPHRLDDILQQAKPVIDRSSIVVCSSLGERVEELMDQISL